ncbi:MAG: hypothetical protein ABSG75_15055 [Syntrophales bacterium]|jgi:hypothetical protein
MITVRRNKVILSVILVLICICFIPNIVDAQAIKTSVSEILSNPDKYDGKLVHIEGRVQSLKFNTSKKGNPYTTFAVVDPSNNSLNVFSFGTLSINRGDSVTVTGRYQKVKHVPPKYTFYNEIEITEDGVKKRGKY